ncbi:iron response transcriptional regulator IrrA [Mesorhizobium sp. LSHC414A00]|uniref:iron response transcriptional regulator IrrA n=1 Tax=Mesorhizobium sp. LSHC414A00 TaxID=1287287 RepID=UPI0003CE7A91|nr:Fur family transcriptional regulator [Mesorhizobium sp. LSHC414A00]ESX71670.1 Fur family transcriptional regulator [Mesorhizobium sp. LSHC414A00]
MRQDVPTAHRLRSAGLKPTAQRIALANLLFGGCQRHVTAEQLHAEAIENDTVLSVATVYNTLHQFTNAGLLRVLAIDGVRTWFDTNVANHHHFFIEGEGVILDVDTLQLEILNWPRPPTGMKIAHVDVVIRLVRE